MGIQDRGINPIEQIRAVLVISVEAAEEEILAIVGNARERNCQPVVNFLTEMYGFTEITFLGAKAYEQVSFTADRTGSVGSEKQVALVGRDKRIQIGPFLIYVRPQWLGRLVFAV
jgi:hypothetical protein